MRKSVICQNQSPFPTAISWIRPRGKQTPPVDLYEARDWHTATLLSDDPSSPHYGQVLVAGGLQHVNGEFTLLNSSELYAGGSSRNIHGYATDRVPLAGYGHPAAQTARS